MKKHQRSLHRDNNARYVVPDVLWDVAFERDIGNVRIYRVSHGVAYTPPRCPVCGAKTYRNSTRERIVVTIPREAGHVAWRMIGWRYRCSRCLQGSCDAWPGVCPTRHLTYAVLAYIQVLCATESDAQIAQLIGVSTAIIRGIRRDACMAPVRRRSLSGHAPTPALFRAALQEKKDKTFGLDISV